MRVLLVAGAFPPLHCGIGDYTAKLAEELANDERTKVAVLTKEESRGIRLERVEVFPVVKNWAMSDLPVILKVVHDWKPDLVHIQYPSQGFTRRFPFLLPIISRLMGVQVVQTWHESYRWRVWTHFLVLYVAAKGLVFVRPNYLDLLPRFFRSLVKARQWIFIPNATSLPTSTLTPDKKLHIRNQYLNGRKRLIVYFGFVYPNKGIEQLFDIANPTTDVLVIAGAIPDTAYVGQLKGLIDHGAWAGNARFTGFMDAEDAADLLAVADAVVLPFLDGGGEWNTSIHSGLAQGTLVITTALEPRGDEPERNLFTASINDTEAMRAALDLLAGRKIALTGRDLKWKNIAARHRDFYQRFV